MQTTCRLLMAGRSRRGTSARAWHRANVPASGISVAISKTLVVALHCWRLQENAANEFPKRHDKVIAPGTTRRAAIPTRGEDAAGAAFCGAPQRWLGQGNLCRAAALVSSALRQLAGRYTPVYWVITSFRTVCPVHRTRRLY